MDHLRILLSSVGHSLISASLWSEAVLVTEKELPRMLPFHRWHHVPYRPRGLCVISHILVLVYKAYYTRACLSSLLLGKMCHFLNISLTILKFFWLEFCIISEKWNWMISTGNDILTGLVPDNLDCNMCGSVPLFQEFRTIGVLFGLKMITSLDDTTFPTAHWSLSHILHCAELSVPERNSPKRKPCIHLLTCNSLWDRTISLIPFVQDRFLITVNT